MAVYIALTLAQGVDISIVIGRIVTALLSALFPVFIGDGGAGDVEFIGTVGVGAVVELEVAAGVIGVGHVEDAGAVGEGVGGGAGRGKDDETGSYKPEVHD